MTHADSMTTPCEGDGCDSHASAIVEGRALCGTCAREAEA